MNLHGSAYHRQPQTRAAGPPREKGLKQSLDDFFFHASTMILHGEDDFLLSHPHLQTQISP
ncbi:hypothetical protein EBT23_01755 [bacterium]|nr:hypothetical protein [bacterium]